MATRNSPPSQTTTRATAVLAILLFLLVIARLAAIILEPDEGGIWSPEETPRIFGPADR